MKKIVRTPEEIVELLDNIQTDALLAEGCSFGLNYDIENKQFWIEWLTGEREL